MASKQKQNKGGPARKQGLPLWAWLALAAAAIGVITLVALLTRPASELADSDPGAGVVIENSLPKEISVEQASQKREEGAFVLDVREPEEWEAGHIDNATLIPLGELQSRLAEIPKDREVVVVCRSGNRSATARDLLLDAGFSSVASMAGGMNDWQSQGLPVSTGP